MNNTRLFTNDTTTAQNNTNPKDKKEAIGKGVNILSNNGLAPSSNNVAGSGEKSASLFSGMVQINKKRSQMQQQGQQRKDSGRRKISGFGSQDDPSKQKHRSTKSPKSPRDQPNKALNKNQSNVSPKNKRPNPYPVGPTLASQSQTTQPLNMPGTMFTATEPVFKSGINYGPKPNPPNLQSLSQMPRSSKHFDSLPSGSGSKIPLPKLNPQRTLNKYIKNYHQLSQFDVINIYYKMKQHPEQVQESLISSLSKSLKILFKTPQKSQKDFTFEKINFSEMTQVQQPNLTPVKKFWYAVIVQFIKNHHPYCSFEGIASLIQFHIKQNRETYYPGGQFNVEIYKQNKIFEATIDKNTQFFVTLIYTLQRLLSVFVNQFCSIVSAIPTNLADKLLSKQQLVTNIWNIFKLMYNNDYQVKQDNSIRLKIASDLISTLYIIHNKNPPCFTKGIVVDFMNYFDSHVQYISRDLNIHVPASQDQSPSSLLGRKCIRLLNNMLFKFPYQVQKWDQPIRTCIKQVKSQCLIPFKWIIHNKKPQVSINSSRYSRASYTDEQQQYKNFYFPIVGTQWMQLLHNLIKYENIQSHNQYFREIIFYLVCSVIEENPYGFWTDLNQYQLIHDYVAELFRSSSIPRSVQSQSFSSRTIQVNELGKIVRIMLCACGKLSLKQNPDNCEQTLQKLKHDSIMLKIISRSSQQHQNNKLSNLVFNHFANNILGIKNMDRKVLFGKVLMGYLVSHEQQYPIYNLDDPIIVKYNYQFPNILINDLFVRILMDDPDIITQLFEICDEYCQEMQPNNLPKSEQELKLAKLTNFLYTFTFLHAINMQQLYFLKSNQYQYQYAALSSLQILPPILELLNKMVLNQSTKGVVLWLLEHHQDMRTSQVVLMLEKAMVYQVNVDALCRHVEVLYEEGLEGIKWVAEICMPIIEKMLGQWQETIARHYANITRIAVHRQCLSKHRHSSLGQLNILGIDPRTQFLPRDVTTFQSHLITIQQLTKFSDYVLQFIMWALRVEQDLLRQEYFYNTLFSSGRYQSLQAALNLLEVLIVVYMKFHDRVYFTQKLKRFLAVCNVSRRLGSSYGSTVLSIAPQIPLSNKKLATLPAALTYLIREPRGRRSTGAETIKAREIRSKALNILSLIILNNNTSIPFLYSMQDSLQTLQDSFSAIDFNIYEQFFINDSQKIYCSSEDELIEYIKSEISNRNGGSTLTPLGWFQSSYNYGQCIDIAAQTNKLFNLPFINQAIDTRISSEFENGDKLRTDMRNAMGRFYLENRFESNAANYKSALPSILVDYLSDREIAAYSRYLLQFSIIHKEGNINQEEFFLKILTVVLNKLLSIIIEDPDSNEKSSIIQPVTTNIWKIFRILQTKKNFSFYIKAIKKSMPFILSPYHLSIGGDQYATEYLTTLRLVLACREYFTSLQYGQILSVSSLKQMLITLMREAAEKPRFYTGLFYCLNFYHNLVQNQRSSREEFKAQVLSIYNSVNETINPVLLLNKAKTIKKKTLKPLKNTQINELCNDVTVVELVMFFKLHISELIPSNSQSLYNLLVTASSDYSTTFNYQSLLLNIEPRPTTQSVEAALKIANASHHYLEYISACNHIYRALGNLDRRSIDSDVVDPVQNLMAEKILAFIERGLDIYPANQMSRSGDNWRNIVFMKSWACNLLYVLMGFCTRPLLIKICHMLLNKNKLISLLGELLSIYGSIQIRWQYTGSKTLTMPRLDLLEKQLLLSILKVYTVMIAKSDDWIKRSGDPVRNNVYYGLCKSFVSASKILTKNSSRFSSFDQIRGMSSLNPLPGSGARTEYQQSLEKISRDHLYKSDLLTLETNTMRSVEHNFKIDPTKLQLVHPECNNSLDIIHSHLNLLITEQYLMILMGCYSNEHLTLETYEYHQILSIFESTTKRLADIYDYRQIFHNAMDSLDFKIWNCYRMDTNLYYLNTIQESPKETMELLNSVAEICFSCILNLKGIMEMHKDYREFITRTDKVLRQAVKTQKAFTFGLKNLMQENGFDKKSQYGTSYMMSPSARLSR